MFSIAICDDDKKDTLKMVALIKDYMNARRIPCQVDTFQSGEELLGIHKVFDLIFLDIGLSGINGIIVGKKIREENRNVKVIYTTSYKQFCKQAVNHVHAFAYLEKPVTRDKAEKQLDEILQYIQEEHEQSETVKFEIMEITAEGEVETRIRDFEVREIFYFEYFDRKIKIKLENKEYFFKDQMKDLAEKMMEHHFEICHQCFLVNLRHVKRIKGYEICLTNDEIIPVSQKRSASFRKKLNQFILSYI
ncbi:LytR/AlgR family response regulator transcription factor [Lacrimispora sp.]|uniref:LytR/AlgR family response regulator transcription factor n=1 Tax=Lacrimispora sp. TaxID=2719234 RepID=UPI00399297E6